MTNRADSLVPTVVRFPPDMHAALKARAEADERTMAQTVRRAVKQYLARSEGS